MIFTIFNREGFRTMPVHTVHKRRILDREYLFPIIMLSLAMAAAVYASLTPDTDAPFLILNGQKIVEAGGGVWENTWNLVPGMSVVIQQPICSLLNYMVYQMAGPDGLWMLALIMNAVLMVSVNRLLKGVTDNTYRRFLVLATLEFVFARSGLVSTRPYQITIALSVLTIDSLIRHNREKSRDIRKWFYHYARLLILVVLQVNYQASMAIMPFLWVLCFAMGDIRELIQGLLPERTKADRWKAVKSFLRDFTIEIVKYYPCMMIAALLNPYGVKGAFYLFYAGGETVQNTADLILEMQKPELISGTTLLVAGNIIGIYLLSRQKNLESWTGYMAAGSILMGAMAGRNMWTLMISSAVIACCLPGEQENANEKAKKKKIPGWIAIGVPVLAALVSIITANNYKKDHRLETPQAIIQLKEEEREGRTIRLYTDFATGSRFALEGFKVFMEARPDIYTRKISGRDLTKEWISSDIEGQDIKGFIQKYEFNYFAVTKTGYIWLYLQEHPEEYELIAEDAFCRLYRAVE